MREMSAAELYREIGDRLFAFGAERAYILSSRVDGAGVMTLEIAVSGEVDAKSMERDLSGLWEDVEIKILSLEDDPLIDYEDGIVL